MTNLKNGFGYMWNTIKYMLLYTVLFSAVCGWGVYKGIEYTLARQDCTATIYIKL